MLELLIAGLAPILLAFGLYAVWEAVEARLALRRLNRPMRTRSDADHACSHVVMTAGVASVWYAGDASGAGHAGDLGGSAGFGGDAGGGAF